MPENAVTVSAIECDACGATAAPSLHGAPDCGGPIVHVGGRWICGRCGGHASPQARCPECASTVELRRAEADLDLRPEPAPHAVERDVHRAVNEKRREHGLPELAFDQHLNGIAMKHSRDMVGRDYFDHDTPEGRTPADRYERAGHDTGRFGENLARTHPGHEAPSRAIAREIVEGWMNSPGHRETMLKEFWRREGVGVYYDTNGAVYTTQNFY